MQQRRHQGQDVSRDDLVSGPGCVGLVGLHHARHSEDALQEEREHRYVVFAGEQGVGLVELLDVVGTVVRRQGDAGQDYFGAVGFESADDLVEIGAAVFNSQAAQAVVSAELDHDDGRFEGEDVVQAADAVLGGVSADALIDYVVVIATGVEICLEVIGVTLADVGSVTGGKTIAEADDDRARIAFSSARR